jgi:hypothetical protein
MTAKDVVEQLKPLRGNEIAVKRQKTCRRMATRCVDVLHLEADDRDSTEASVLLWRGTCGADGATLGVAMAPHRIAQIEWLNPQHVQVSLASGRSIDITIVQALPGLEYLN